MQKKKQIYRNPFLEIYIYKSLYRGGIGDCPPPENFPPPKQFRGGGSQNVPLLSDSGGGTEVAQGGGTKIFLGALRPICPPPELNPVSAPVQQYIYNTIYMCI